ncbi:MAG: hypothetical protein ACYDEE_05950 [Ignavibacteriaceae bacterium]
MVRVLGGGVVNPSLRPPVCVCYCNGTPQGGQDIGYADNKNG